jgi:transposase
MTERSTKQNERVIGQVIEEVIGVDIGDKYSQICVLDKETGTILEETRIRSTKPAFERWFDNRAPARVVMEAGTHSPWMSRLVASFRHQVIVANPRQLALISESVKKNDRMDARLLARLGRVDPELLAPIEHRSEELQADLAVVRTRDRLVRVRTQLINHMRGVTKSFGERLPKVTAGAFANKVDESVPAALEPALDPVLTTLITLEQQIRKMDRQIEAIREERYPEAKVLEQVWGVAVITSLTFVLTLGRPDRFKSSRSAGAFLGLVPGQKQSGDDNPQLRITKQGNKLLRRLLVGSANRILVDKAPDTDLKRHGLAICARGGKNAKKRALVAVARKLAILLHHLWKTGEVYDPLHNANKQEGVAA